MDKIEKEALLEKVKNIVQEASAIRGEVLNIPELRVAEPNPTLLVLLLLQLRELTVVLDNVVTAINNVGTDEYPLRTRSHEYD
jgi:hypothetical protein